MILIVDDSPFERTVMRAILEEAGFEVREAQSGRQALEQARQEPPRLIITDVVMPEMDGLEMTRQLRRSDQSTPVAMITGLEDPQIILRGLEAGADGFLPKPYSHEELKALVEGFWHPTGPSVHAEGRHLFALLRTSLERQTQLQRRLEERERRLQGTLSLLGALDQELRTPLEALRSWLADRAATDALAELGLRRAARLLTRLDELQDVRRLETGEAALDRVSVPVEETLLIAMEAARVRGLQVRAAPLPPNLAVRADPGRLLQAMLLLLNFAGQAGPVALRAYRSGSNVAFEVRSRRGLPPHEAAPLAIARQLLELQGGLFAQDVREGKGTTFRFNLPAA